MNKLSMSRSAQVLVEGWIEGVWECVLGALIGFVSIFNVDVTAVFQDLSPCLL